MQTWILPALSDNYIYLLADAGGAWVVDPGEAAPVLAQLQRRKLQLRTVLLTHRHADHTDGAAELRRVTGCVVAGPAECSACGLDRTLAEGETVDFGAHALRVLEVPGHTRGHLAYYSESMGSVWTGDTLFAGGCGRIVEGTAGQMWSSLCRLRALPPETRVYCGHDYTLDNLKFASSILPDDPRICLRLSQVWKLVKEYQPTVPSKMSMERKSNLFLRAEEEQVRNALHLQTHADPVAVFAELRRRKDAWF